MKKYMVFLIAMLFSYYSYSQDYIFVHGWLGDGSDWNNSGIENLIELRAHSDILKPSLTGSQSASTQSLNLRNYLNSNNVIDGTSIAFSMGGMTTRYHLRRQYDQSISSRLGYNFTIASPHYGTAVANNTALATRIILVGGNSNTLSGLA
jgi:triacylglycerol esterase/lipase EstA (alpha/beta hydrolase family)